ncbi:sensor histidine kinase [Methylocella sp.]|uniref:sensor histidine kinase n=1 Tax=Methylocella sp. TaxID=1978226 RepID=UPI003782EFDF
MFAAARERGRDPGRRAPLALLPMLAAPICLWLHGAPRAPDAALLLAAVLPLCALAILAAAGARARLEAVSALGLVGAALATAVGAGAGAGALFWLALAPLDALAAFDAGLILACGAAALIAATGAAAADLLGLPGAEGLARPAVWAIAACGAATLFALACVRGLAGRTAAGARGLARPEEAAGDLVLLHDRSGVALALSGDCAGLLGLPAAALMGRGFFERVHVADRPAFLQAIDRAAGGRGPARAGAAAFRLRAAGAPREGREDPVFLWLDMRARGAGAGRAVAVLRDVSALKTREEELETARAQAEALSLSKDRLLASMSHELRTPLNAIIGFSELLGDAAQAPRDPGKQREYAAIIHQSGQHLLAVVNSLLDLSKIRSGAFALAPAPFAVAPLIEACCDMVRLDAKERGVRLTQAVAPEVGEIVGDTRACRQILINLLSNAVKFTPRGGEARVLARLEGGFLALVVADSGVGIAEQDLSRLGSPFFQAQGGRERPQEGTGLGLSIVCGLVGLHGGEMSIASEPHQGACVTVRLPLDCRRAGDRMRPLAEIETIARYRRADPSVETSMVKKIA